MGGIKMYTPVYVYTTEYAPPRSSSGPGQAHDDYCQPASVCCTISHNTTHTLLCIYTSLLTGCAESARVHTSRHYLIVRFATVTVNNNKEESLLFELVTVEGLIGRHLNDKTTVSRSNFEVSSEHSHRLHALYSELGRVLWL